jgi:hypothetical protein
MISSSQANRISKFNKESNRCWRTCLIGTSLGNLCAVYSQAHDMETVVNVESSSSDGRRQGRDQECSGVADVLCKKTKMFACRREHCNPGLNFVRPVGEGFPCRQRGKLPPTGHQIFSQKVVIKRHMVRAE